jgi:hypothetical protein
MFKQQPFNNRKFDIRLWVLVVGSKNPNYTTTNSFMEESVINSTRLLTTTSKMKPFT